MKRILVYSSANFVPTAAQVGSALDRFRNEHKWDHLHKVDVCLRHRGGLMGQVCTKLALHEEFTYAEGVNAPTADRLRKKMLDKADGAVIFWDTKSAGTKKLIDMVEEKGILFAVHIV